MNVRIVLWDLETLPNLPEALKVFPQLSDYPGLTLKAQINSIICFGWKVLGEKKVSCVNAWDFPGWDKDVNHDKELCKAAYDVLKDANVVVTHNGKRFDWRFLQTRLLIHGFPPLPKIIHIDTCSESKKYLYTFNNRLNNLAKCFSLRKKVDHEGWDLWVKTHAKDKKALEKMTRYCKGDVLVLEEIFNVMRPLIKGIPNENQFVKHDCCPKCGSDRMQSRGFSMSKEKTNRRFQCQDCGSWSTVHVKGMREL